LFSDEDEVDLEAVMTELQNYSGNVWTHIMSLKREDAERLGYNNGAAWRDLIRSRRNDIAAAMNISPDNFRWYAAFHNEGHHPHIHMMAWSADGKQGYLNKEGLHRMKSLLTNDIFQMDMLHLYEEKSQSRDELVEEARKAVSELAGTMSKRIANYPELEELILELSKQLPDKGKKSYGYLPKSQKTLVDEIVDKLENLPTVHNCYEKWMEMQHQVNSYYKDEELQRIPLSQQKEFRSIKNAVIRQAENIRRGKISFEDDTDTLEEQSEHDLPRESVAKFYWTTVHDEDYFLQERDEAVSKLKEKAETGDALAQYYLGKLYRDGGIVIPDEDLAKAAGSGLPTAQYALGSMLLEEDSKAAMDWLQKAADSGNGAATYRLGKEYVKQQDMDKAKEYFRQSASAGNQYAQYMLGKICLMEDNREKAIEYFTLSAQQGNNYARYFLDRQDELKQPSLMLAVTKLIHHMSRIFQDNIPQLPSNNHIDHKRRKELGQKRQAMGVKGGLSYY
jgi:hypothetical protein